MTTTQENPDMQRHDTPGDNLGAEERRVRVLRGIEVGYGIVEKAVLDIQSVIDDPTTPTDQLRQAIDRTGPIDDLRVMLDTVSDHVVSGAPEIVPVALSPEEQSA